MPVKLQRCQIWFQLLHCTDGGSWWCVWVWCPPSLDWDVTDWSQVTIVFHSQIKRVEIRSCQHQYERKQRIKNVAQNSNHVANVLRSYKMYLLNGNEQTKKEGRLGAVSLSSASLTPNKTPNLCCREQITRSLQPDYCVSDYPSPCVATLTCQNKSYKVNIQHNCRQLVCCTQMTCTGQLSVSVCLATVKLLFSACCACLDKAMTLCVKPLKVPFKMNLF